MRKQFCDAMLQRAVNPKMAFLTGDLGFMALEPLQKALGERFINAGIAEQNMLSVAAAMSKTGMEIWVYSIAPFCYARAFEQIRNDVAFHCLPVKIVGNGGGYGYGVQGPTHHAIEDYGVILTLPYLQVCIPVFDEDLDDAVSWIANNNSPTYLRLGRGEQPSGFQIPSFEPWRLLVEGKGPVVVVCGPLASTYIAGVQSMPKSIRPNLWAVSVLPVQTSPPHPEMLRQLAKTGKLIVAEEHVQRGGLASELMLWLAERGLSSLRFIHLYAKAHRFERYGSQSYLRIQSELDPLSLQVSLNSLK